MLISSSQAIWATKGFRFKFFSPEVSFSEKLFYNIRMSTGLEFESSNDKLKIEKDQVWAFYAIEGGEELRKSLLGIRDNLPMILKARTIAYAILDGPNVEGEIRSILMQFLINTDGKV